MIPYVVLGTYHPATWKSWLIGKELTQFTEAKGLVPHVDPAHGAQEWVPWYNKAKHAEVRIWTVKNPKGTDWHQDGDLTAGAKMDCALVLWADHTPTQFKANDGVIYQPAPYEVVIARNQGCTHRRPPEAKGERWVFRQRVAIPTQFPLP